MYSSQNVNIIIPENSTVSFFTPTYYIGPSKGIKHNYFNFAEGYFDYGNRKVFKIEKDHTKNCYIGQMEESKKKNLLFVALKIISLVTIILPLIMIITKAYFRLNSCFAVRDEEENKERTRKLLRIECLGSNHEKRGELRKSNEIVLFKSGELSIMSNDPDSQYLLAMKQYDKGQYEDALKLFSELALDLFLTKGESAIAEIEKSMIMAVASYKKIDDKATTMIIDEIGSDLWDQFFSVMRHYQDYKIETDPLKVQEEIARVIPLGVPEERLGMYPEGEKTFEENKAGPYLASVFTAQGPREQMEDEHLITELHLNRHGQHIDIPFFGVFDGHGGISCAYYVKQELPKALEKELEEVITFSDLEIYNALRKAFIRIDKNWAGLQFQKPSHRDYSGTTATVSLIINNSLWVVNVGDSRTVLALEDTPLQLSEEAKATVDKYKKEIYLRGGDVDVQNGRVIGELGTLDMARSIGDVDQPSVSALPTIRKIDLGTLEYGKKNLILACDGLWDVVSPDLAAGVCKQSQDTKEAAEKLLLSAFLRGTTDNVSIMVVDLNSSK